MKFPFYFVVGSGGSNWCVLSGNVTTNRALESEVSRLKRSLDETLQEISTMVDAPPFFLP